MFISCIINNLDEKYSLKLSPCSNIEVLNKILKKVAKKIVFREKVSSTCFRFALYFVIWRTWFEFFFFLINFKFLLVQLKFVVFPTSDNNVTRPFINAPQSEYGDLVSRCNYPWTEIICRQSIVRLQIYLTKQISKRLENLFFSFFRCLCIVLEKKKRSIQI